jgi:hypothetical protein
MPWDPRAQSSSCKSSSVIIEPRPGQSEPIYVRALSMICQRQVDIARAQRGAKRSGVGSRAREVFARSGAGVAPGSAPRPRLASGIRTTRTLAAGAAVGAYRGLGFAPLIKTWSRLELRASHYEHTVIVRISFVASIARDFATPGDFQSKKQQQQQKQKQKQKQIQNKTMAYYA